MQRVWEFLCRWLLPCFRGELDDLETSIQGCSGNKSSNWQWQKNLGRHMYGQFSMAVVQANLKNEDRSQLVSGLKIDAVNGPRGVFVGIYDGHGGTTCSQFVHDNLLRNLKTAITNHPDSGDGVNIPAVIQEAYQRTEERFVDYVRNNWLRKPRLAVMGSCCLVGVVYKNILYVANAGDSRAVLGKCSTEGGLEQLQLSVDDNTRDKERRDEFVAENPTNTSLHQRVDGSFLVRGMVTLTRAIGDMYLKDNEFNKEPLPSEFIQQPIVQPILKAEPTIHTHQLGPNDRFVIFASHGLWDEISNQEAVMVVEQNPRPGAAEMLVRFVLHRIASKNTMLYLELESVKIGARRRYHDDISVIILFFDNLQAAIPSAENALPKVKPRLSGRVNSMPDDAIVVKDQGEDIENLDDVVENCIIFPSFTHQGDENDSDSLILRRRRK